MEARKRYEEWMMPLMLREAETRGRTRIDWLDSYHTFSFGDYRDPQFMGFSDLRVINDDYIAPGKGFSPHGHRDMEILTYVLAGAVAHRDSMGNIATVSAGELQRMSAGTGVTHSEFNPSPDTPLHLLQIWIYPNQKDLPPSYEQMAISDEAALGVLHPIASPTGGPGVLTIHQDVTLSLARLSSGQTLDYTLPAGRMVWIHVSRGSLTFNGTRLNAGDGVGVPASEVLFFVGETELSEFLLFDLKS